MPIYIRKAVREDCLSIMELVHELAIYVNAPNSITVSMEHFIDSGFGEKPVWWAYVAEQDGQIIGFALWYVRYSTWKGQRMYLEDLVVTDKLRGKGIGKLLFDQLIQECKTKNYSGLVWQVISSNEPAINFYKKYTGMIIDKESLNCSIEIKK